MYYPQELIEQIRLENDIVDVVSQYLALNKKGNSYFGLCPFHNESTPSFSVSPDKQLYYCFGCGASGNVISFIMAKENYDFQTALKFLADRAHITLPEQGDVYLASKNEALKSELYEIHKHAARYYYDCLKSDSGEAARSYLDKRSIYPKTRIKFGLGYSPEKWDGLYEFLLGQGYDIDLLLKSGLILRNKKGGYYDRFRNRLMFPILDIMGRVVGFGGRVLEEGGPKYLNSPETLIFEKSRNLYSLNFAKGNKELILVEGYMDVISLYQKGFTNAVAALGTAFNESHAKILNKYAKSVIVLFDSDEAGEAAVLRALQFILKTGMGVKVLQLKGAKDPDEFINKYGPEAFGKAAQEALSHIAFNISVLQKKYDLNISEEKISFTKEVSKMLSGLSSPVERAVYIKEAERLTGISESAIKAEIEGIENAAFKTLNTQRKENYNYIKKGTLSEKGIVEAKKGIIAIVSERRELWEIIKLRLRPEEMGGGVYEDILRKVYMLHEENKPINPADLVSLYQEPSEQKAVSDIFTTTIAQNDLSGLETALNDQLKLIKRNYIENKMNITDDVKELQLLMEEKRNIESLNITLKDS
ncbi:MAG: DNA primase [Lachnospiraceae bacterium]|nr:DNA primase [Lachnospiraceae bacterium]